MRSSYQRQREYERERSRDRKRGYSHQRDSQQEVRRHRYPMNYDHHRVPHQQIPRRKTITFNQNPDIRVFKKQDQPSAKPLTEADIVQFKTKLDKDHQEKGYVLSTNSEEARHRQARMESDRLKEQKQKEKSLNQRLIAIRQQMSYYSPLNLLKTQQINPNQSYQKEQHTQRIGNELGCFYSSLNQIPNQPTFQLLNNGPSSTPVPISYQRTLSSFNYSQYHQSQRKDQKPLKSILKQAQIAPHFQNKHSPFGNTNPNLVRAIQDITRNKSFYNKEQVEAMLSPFKETGDLQKLMADQTLYKSIIESAYTPQPIVPAYSNYNYRVSPTPNIVDKRPNMMRSSSPMDNSPGYSQGLSSYTALGVQPISASKLQKFKTVPCKYFHSPQGCVKKDDCTFIHDEQYAGRPTPNMNRYVRGTNQTPSHSYGNYGNMGSNTQNMYGTNPSYPNASYTNYANTPNYGNNQPSFYQNYNNRTYQNNPNPNQTAHHNTMSNNNPHPATNQPYGNNYYGYRNNGN